MGQDTLLRFCSRLPILGRDNGQTHLALLVDVRVIDFGQESDARWLERVFGWEVDVDFKCALIVWLTVLKNGHLENTRYATLHVARIPRFYPT